MPAPLLLNARPGDHLPPMQFAPLTRHDFALYCGGSGDHNPLHTDSDFARESGGQDDVIGHGMLSMALAGRFLTALAPVDALESCAVRFVGKTGPGDSLTCNGKVITREETGGILRLALNLMMIEAHGREILNGQAIIAVRRS